MASWGRGRAGWPVIATALLLAASTAGEAADRQIARGRHIARVACAGCHAIGRSGDSPRAEAPRFRELGRKYPLSHLEETLAEGVLVGHPAMPEIKMNEADIGAFLAWLATIQVP